MAEGVREATRVPCCPSRGRQPEELGLAGNKGADHSLSKHTEAAPPGSSPAPELSGAGERAWTPGGGLTPWLLHSVCP